MARLFRTLALGSLTISGARMATRGFSFVSVLLITAGLSVQDYGVLALALSVSGPVLTLSGLALDDVVLATAARLRGEHHAAAAADLMRGFALQRILMAALAIVAMGLLPGVLGPTYEPVVRGFILPLQCWVAMTILSVIGNHGVQLQERFPVLATSTIAESAVRLAVVGAFVFMGQLSVATVLWSYVIAKGAGVVLLVPGVGAFLSPGNGMRSAAAQVWKLMRGGGKWEMARGGVDQLFSGVDVWLLGLVAGLQAVAVYSLAVTVKSVISQMLPFRQILFPVLARMSSETRGSAFVAQRMSKYGIWFYAAVVLLAAVTMPWAVALFFPKYASAVPVFYLVLPSLFLDALSMSHAPLLYAHGQQRFLLAVSAVNTAAVLAALPAFSKALGAAGALLVHQASTAAMIVVREWRLRRLGVRSFVLRDLATVDDFDRRAVARIVEAARSRLRGLRRGPAPG
ncbi:lipopolysaccharide biosynthesis protein [Patescibacteria group bacterium]|nr:MAG: lipopolysaccharide biosynthesis protein [Patescibacteria group bacterium]